MLGKALLVKLFHGNKFFDEQEDTVENQLLTLPLMLLGHGS